MNDMRMPADIRAKADDCVELLRVWTVEADHIVDKANFQECSELQKSDSAVTKFATAKHLQSTLVDTPEYYRRSKLKFRLCRKQTTYNIDRTHIERAQWESLEHAKMQLFCS